MSRQRRPRVHEGELHIYWGKADKHTAEDVVYHNGDGTSQADLRLLHRVIGTDSQHLNWNAPSNASRLDWVTYEPSLLNELEKRGYDLTTLRFYIRKKKAGEVQEIETRQPDVIHTQ